MILRHVFDFPWECDEEEDCEVPPDGPGIPYDSALLGAEWE